MVGNSDEVVVVGGGVIGLSAARDLLRSGRPVRVLEREPEGGDSCSLGNAGLVVPSHFIPLAAPGMISKGLRWMLSRESPFYVRPRLSPELLRWGWLFRRACSERQVAASRELLRDLNLESRRLFVEMAGEEGFGLETRGLMMLCRTQKGLDEEAEAAAMARELGLEAEVLDPAGVARLDPDATMSIIGGVHFPQDCHLDPARFMAVLQRQIVALGGVIERQVDVTAIETRGGRVSAVAGGGRRYEAADFVIAGGAWTAGLLRQVGLRLPLQAGKGYSLTVPGPPELPRVSSVLVEGRVAVTPMASALRFAGTMEISGLSRAIDPARVRGIIRTAGEYLPRFTEEVFDGVEAWAGLRPVSPDGVPYLGKVAGLENLVVGSGHAMMGLSLGPVSGRLIAGLINGEEPFRPIAAMAVGRFS